MKAYAIASAIIALICVASLQDGRSQTTVRTENDIQNTYKFERTEEQPTKLPIFRNRLGIKRRPTEIQSLWQRENAASPKEYMLYGERLGSFAGVAHPPRSHHASPSTLLAKAGNEMPFSGNVQTAWMNQYASGLAPAYDVATAVAVDGLGNAYVTGYSTNLPFGMDYFTIKYDPSGRQLWTARYNGDANGDDFALAICVDGSGNVYVTGQSAGQNTYEDYATVKYNSSGVVQWVVRYNGSGGGADIPAGMAVDAAGNVYVTGTSDGSTSSADYATVKYNAAGVRQWVARYDGPGVEDEAVALAIDQAGNVCVTGNSGDSSNSTVKYNAAGVEQWNAHYRASEASQDWVAAIAVDAFGNVCVAGGSVINDATGSDYAIVKYNATGAQVWAARYGSPTNSDQATSIAVDQSGNIYVTGATFSWETDLDFATVKYNPLGVEEWATLYHGQQNESDTPIAVALDHSGNVYVTGASYNYSTYTSDYATIKYNSSGVEQWQARYAAPGESDDQPAGLALDGSGNVYVAGWSGSWFAFDYLTVKYNASGSEQWAVRYDGPGNSRDQAVAITHDAFGNVYMAGVSHSAATFDDFVISKYNPSGALEWIARFDGPSNSSDAPADLAVDGAGNIYVTGSSHDPVTQSDYVTIKYNSAGAQQWAARYNGPNNIYDQATDIALDATGNVYVTGGSSSRGSGSATIKYNPSGVEQWIARDGFGASDIAVDASGNVYVTGTASGPEGERSWGTAKYNAAGERQWSKSYHAPGWRNAMAAALALDASGNVYVTGRSDNGTNGYDYATIKYSSSGTQEWIAYYNGPESSYDGATAIGMDEAGNIYVTGRSQGSGTSEDYTTIKYNSSGLEQWVARYNGPGNSADTPVALALDISGNVYITGRSAGLGTSADFATIKYNPAGVEQWATRYSGPANSADGAVDLSVDPSGNVYVTGSCVGFENRWSICVTLKYVQVPEATVSEVTRSISAIGTDIVFASASGDTLAVINFSSENLDSVKVRAHLNSDVPNKPGEAKAVFRYDEITPYPSGATFNGTMSLYYEQTEFTRSGLLNESGLKLYRFDGSQWQLRGGAADALRHRVTIAGVTAFSTWAFADPNDHPLSGEIKPLVTSPQLPGAEFFVDVEVSAVQNLFGISFELNYTNTDYLDVVTPISTNVLPGPFLGSDVVFLANVDEAAGKASIAITRKSGQGGVDGTGIVARIKFKSLPSTPLETPVALALSNVSASDPAGNPISLTATAATLTITGVIVWPGDTNNNGIVNQADVLPLGLHWSKTGPARPNASTTWVGQPASPWSPLAATYADANGNGTVNQADVLPIGLNWNKTHSVSALAFGKENAQEMPVASTVPNLRVAIIGDANPGKEFALEVCADSVTNLFGISFELRYAPVAFINQPIVERTNPQRPFTGWLGEDLIFFANVDTTAGKISIGMSCKVGQSGVNGCGVVARLKMRMSNQAAIGQSITLTLHEVTANDPNGNPIHFNVINGTIVTSVASRPNALVPQAFALYPNLPNPFNPTTMIKYDLAEAVEIRLDIYDMLGRHVRSLVNAHQQAGRYAVIWDGRDETGRIVASGAFIYQLRVADPVKGGTEKFVQSRKMVLLR